MWRRILAFALCLSLAVGCAPVLSWRTDLAHHYQAHKAWSAHKANIARRPCGEADFACGWKQGYFDAACGSNGAPPPIPPESYWKPYFQTPEGRKQVDAWYEGYHNGVIAADQDNAGELARIPTAPGLGTPPLPWQAPMPPVDVPGEEALPGPELNAARQQLTPLPAVESPGSASTPVPRQIVAPPAASVAVSPLPPAPIAASPPPSAPIAVSPPAASQIVVPTPRVAATQPALPPAAQPQIPAPVSVQPSIAATPKLAPQIARRPAPPAIVVTPPEESATPPTDLPAEPVSEPAVVKVVPPSSQAAPQPVVAAKPAAPPIAAPSLPTPPAAPSQAAPALVKATPASSTPAEPTPSKPAREQLAEQVAPVERPLEQAPPAPTKSMASQSILKKAAKALAKVTRKAEPKSAPLPEEPTVEENAPQQPAPQQVVVEKQPAAEAEVVPPNARPALGPTVAKNAAPAPATKQAEPQTVPLAQTEPVADEPVLAEKGPDQEPAGPLLAPERVAEASPPSEAAAPVWKPLHAAPVVKNRGPAPTAVAAKPKADAKSRKQKPASVEPAPSKSALSQDAPAKAKPARSQSRPAPPAVAVRQQAAPFAGRKAEPAGPPAAVMKVPQTEPAPALHFATAGANAKNTAAAPEVKFRVSIGTSGQELVFVSSGEESEGAVEDSAAPQLKPESQPALVDQTPRTPSLATRLAEPIGRLVDPDGEGVEDGPAIPQLAGKPKTEPMPQLTAKSKTAPAPAKVVEPSKLAKSKAGADETRPLAAETVKLDSQSGTSMLRFAAPDSKMQVVESTTGSLAVSGGKDSEPTLRKTKERSPATVTLRPASSESKDTTIRFR